MRTKDFNLKEVINFNKEIITTDGRKARILATDIKAGKNNPDCMAVAIMDSNGMETLEYYTKDGHLENGEILCDTKEKEILWNLRIVSKEITKFAVSYISNISKMRYTAMQIFDSVKEAEKYIKEDTMGYDYVIHEISYFE